MKTELAHIVDSTSFAVIARVPVALINDHDLLESNIPASVKDYFVVCDESDLERFTIRDGLPRLYNVNSGNDIKKFANSDIGRKRVLEALAAVEGVPVYETAKGRKKASTKPVAEPDAPKAESDNVRSRVLAFFDEQHEQGTDEREVMAQAKELFPQVKVATVRTYHFHWRIAKGLSRPEYYDKILGYARAGLTRMEAINKMVEELRVSPGAAKSRINNYYAKAKQEIAA